MNLVTSIALAILGGIFAAIAAFGGIRAAWRGLGRRRGAFAALAALAAACTILAQKTSILFDRLISDAGSYATNDVLHVAATNAAAYAAFDFTDSDLLVYRRERGLTNAADWVECLPRRKYGDQPADWHVPDATNYDYLVAVDYVPPSPVHTNGVFELRGFVVPGDEPGNLEQLAAGFATSTIVDNREIVPIEYLESTGTQYIKTEILLPASFTILSTIESHNTQYGFLCGARTANQSNDRFAILANGAQMIGFDFTSKDGYRDKVNIRDRVVDVTAIVSNSIMRVFSAGSSTIIPEARTKPLCPCPLWLFECNTGNKTTTFKGKYRLYSFSLYDNDTRRYLLDFQPVRVGTVGYLFDRVLGEYLPFGNKGTGAFIVGPDIKE